MKILTYGEIMDGGVSVFHSVAKLDGDRLFVTFEGAIRIDNPYRFLEPYLNDLSKVLPEQLVTDTRSTSQSCGSATRTASTSSWTWSRPCTAACAGP